jgi:hypothetical protein
VNLSLAYSTGKNKTISAMIVDAKLENGQKNTVPGVKVAILNGEWKRTRRS